jgi:uncharacterized protein YkwD
MRQVCIRHILLLAGPPGSTFERFSKTCLETRRIIMRKIYCSLAVFSIIFLSCETLGINLSALFPSSQSGAPVSSSDSRGNSRTSINSSQSAKNPNKRADPDAANWDIEKLDTAKDAEYLSAVERDVILEMNKVRTNPKKYAELYIQPQLKYYSGKNYSVPGEITIVTQEGAAAVNGCIAALNKASSVGILTPEKGMSLAAKDHVTDQSKTGQTGHNGSDKSTPESRMKRYGKFSGSWTLGENIAYGQTSGRDIVCALLIDDGVPSRGHRTNIMNKAFTQTGTAYGTHIQYRTSCTITYGNGYIGN